MGAAARSTLILVATFLAVFSLNGQETCAEEVKLLLSPTQVQAAIGNLRARGRLIAISIFMTYRVLICSRGA
jgi:hypothetical protein